MVYKENDLSPEQLLIEATITVTSCRVPCRSMSIAKNEDRRHFIHYFITRWHAVLRNNNKKLHAQVGYASLYNQYYGTHINKLFASECFEQYSHSLHCS